MKRIFSAILVTALFAGGLHAQEQLDFNDPSIPEVSDAQDGSALVSGHAVSFTLLGLEYSYEKALGGNWTLVMRAGFPCALSEVVRSVYTETVTVDDGVTRISNSETSRSFNVNYAPCPGITLEPRYYTNLQSRYFKGKKTANNCADFVSMQAKVYYAYNGGENAVNLSLIPVYGIRRGGGHWFREYTFGAAFHTFGLTFLPHIGFRLGYTL